MFDCVMWQLDGQLPLPPRDQLPKKVTHVLLDPKKWNELESTPESNEALEEALCQFNTKQHHPAVSTVLVVTDPAETKSPIGLSCDGFYVPGPHCRQGDLLQAAGESNKDVWVERGSFLAPSDLRNVFSRVPTNGKVTLVEAGSQNGYADRVLDTRALCLYETWNAAVCLSYSDLRWGGENVNSAFRPHWANSDDLRAHVFRCAQTWNNGLIFKTHPQWTAVEQQAALESLESFSQPLQDHNTGSPRPS